jgi:hypothetical protein
LFLIKVF